MSPQLADARKQAMYQTSLVGALVNSVLSAGKIVFGYWGQSSALIADGVHSLADLITDLMVWFAARFSTQPADKDHPYGHGRIETLFTVLLGLVLLVTSAGIAWDAAKRMFEPENLLQPAPFVLIIAAISVVVKEALYQYTMIYARRFSSGLLKANAWHHRSDAISSVVVLVGVAGSLMGVAYLDAVAAALVAFMIGKIGWEQLWKAVLELIDTGLDPKKTKEIKTLIKQIEGVQDVHMLRTRLMGGNPMVDVHVEVSGKLSVSEGHRISEHVRKILLQSNKDIVDVTVHIDPENDEVFKLSNKLPLRSDVMQALKQVWHAQWHDLAPEKITLHYLKGKVHVDIYCQASVDAALQQQLQHLAQSLSYIGDVTLYRTINP
jgi:cation diffusion facilitator family transporter